MTAAKRLCLGLPASSHGNHNTAVMKVAVNAVVANTAICRRPGNGAMPSAM